MEIFTLWPLSQGEMNGTKSNFIDHVFAKQWRSAGPQLHEEIDIIELVVRGGYPVVQQRESESRRRGWFGGYLTTVLQRDIRELSNISDVSMLPRFLSVIATRTCALLNFADLSNTIDIPQTTLRRYMELLVITFLVQLLNPWSINIGKRLVKTPKVYLNDTGLAAYLLGLSHARLAADRMALGPLLENFVLMELRKQAGWSKVRPQFLHFRTHTGFEVDIVLEDASANVVGIEVKAGASVAASDFKGLRALAALAGKRFRRGIVFYTGKQAVPFGKDLHALPLAALWE
jgi:predicted AAA+ superfamily ATPase